MDKVSDERLDVLVQQRAHDEEWYLTELQTFYLLRELQERRAADTMRPEWHHADEPAEREQAAPEPRLAKWERRLDRMSGGLHFNYSGGEGWYASWMIDGGVVKYAYGDTPKAAVKAARRAWREARDER